MVGREESKKGVGINIRNKLFPVGCKWAPFSSLYTCVHVH